MKLHAATRIVLTTCATAAMVATSSVAFAEAPMDLAPQVRVEDTTKTLGNTTELKNAISKLSDQHQVNLFVVTIDKFEAPSNSESWAKQFASMNNMGSNDVLLVIATDARQAYFVAGGQKVLSSDETNNIYQQDIYPHLKDSDYAAAALGAANGLDTTLAGGSSKSSSSSPSSSSGGGIMTGVGIAGGVAAVAAGGAWLMSRRRRQDSTGASNNGYNGQVPQRQQQLVPIPQLRQDAGQLLVQVDDAVANSEQEVEFARLQYGEREVAPFVSAITAAKEHMQRSFQLQKQLDDEIPDTEADQRAWLGEIITRCKEASAELERQKQNFTDLRQLEIKAPEILASLEQRYQKCEQMFSPAEQTLARVKSMYASSAVEPFSTNISESRSRLGFARQSMDAAVSHMSSDRSAAVLEIRAAEEAVGQAQKMLNTVMSSENDLAQAKQALDSAILVAEKDVAQARELSKFGNTGELAGAAAGVSAVIDQIKAESAAPRSDPFALTRKLTEVRADLDQALKNVRQVQDRQRSASDTLQHTLVSAQAQVSSASQYLWARRGGVNSQARTTLREAERHLAEAQRLQRTDPEAALTHANSAMSLASDAQAMAQNDVDAFNQGGFGGYGTSGGRDMGSAMLGGILLGSILNNGGGIFGGGGYGGGFGGGGDFGG
ncbi:MAG: TPM domain-containing protein, partial [Rothia sp. (in: high G+C Gram-positive bacteria)]|nr:TPM domain-containing protein [Rothia sp. (in: high G+C Gram-positive bacteria)]